MKGETVVRLVVPVANPSLEETWRGTVAEFEHDNAYAPDESVALRFDLARNGRHVLDHARWLGFANWKAYVEVVA